MRRSGPGARAGTPEDHIKAARARVVVAGRQLETAREEARLAKRHRKETKLIARQAKRRLKAAKKALAAAKEVFADAEAKLAKLGKRATALKSVKAPRATKPRAAVAGEKAPTLAPAAGAEASLQSAPVAELDQAGAVQH
jgi:chromosome segregation ATPase